MAGKEAVYYYPGDLIYVGKPFVSCIEKSVQKHICGRCFSRSGNLKFCGSCRVTKYCSKFCQKEAWPDHKLECQFLKNSDEEPGTLVQLAAKVIMKVKDKDWARITERFANKVVSFADLISHTDALDSNPKLKLFFMEAASEIKKCIGEENIPQEEKLFEIIGKVKFNTYGSSIPLPFNARPSDFAASSKSQVAEMNILFIGLSKLNHSCIPNTYFHYENGIAKLRATKIIRKDEELTVNYFPMVCVTLPNKIREGVKEGFFGDCKCSDCSSPYGTSVLTKIIDETRAHRIINSTEIALEFSSLLLLLRVTEHINFPRFYGNVKKLLKMQEGVLGDTNILRMRLLALKCFHIGGPPNEQLEDLEKLAEYMKLAFGENYVELILVYDNLLEVSHSLLDFNRIRHYTKELFRLRQVILDDDPTADIRKFMTSFFHIF